MLITNQFYQILIVNIYCLLKKSETKELVYYYLYLIYTYYDVQVMSRISKFKINNLVEAIRLLHVIIIEGCVKACF